MSDKCSRLFVFHGCDRKVGTTMVAHSAAKILSNMIADKKILFVSLNGNDDIHYSKNNSSSIDSIKMRVDNRLLTAQDMEACCARDEHLYVMGGVSGVFEHRKYSAEFPLLFIEKAYEVFDIVIVDCGNELDSGLCIGALKACGTSVMVLNQNETSLVRYEKSGKIYSAIDAKFLIYVINRYSENDPHDVSYIRSRLCLNKERIFTVKNETLYSRLAEIDQQLILEYRCPGFSDDIKDIVLEMMKMAEFTEDVKISGKRKLFGFM